MNTVTSVPDKALLRLLSWLSPSFPVGAYAYSHGAESAVENGQIFNRETALSWVTFILQYGTGRMDADLFVAAYGAARENNSEHFVSIVRKANALKGTAELGLESRAQGQAFWDTVLKAWPDEKLAALVQAVSGNNVPPSYATAVAAAVACAGIERHTAVRAYLFAFAANITSAIVRLVPLGQTDGQRIIAALEDVIGQSCKDALKRDACDMGSAAFFVDMMSMKHETQYSRMFRS